MKFSTDEPGSHHGGGSWAHEVLRRARELPSHQRVSLGSGAAVAKGARAPKSEGAAALEPDGEVPRPVATVRPRLSSLSIATPCRHNLRQEPDAVMPLVRICAGGGPKGSSLPQPPFFPNCAPDHCGVLASQLQAPA
jgi:hypothetical protein